MKDQGAEKIKRASHTLVGKIMIYMLILVAAVALLVVLFEVLFLDDIYMSVKKNSIYGYSSRLEEQQDDSKIKEIAESLSSGESLCIAVFDKSTNALIATCEGLEDRCALHKVIYRPYIMGYALDVKNINKLSSEAEKSGGDVLLSVTPEGLHSGSFNLFLELDASGKEQSVIYVKNTVSGSGNDIIIMINSVISPLESTVAAMNIILAVMGIVFILLALGFSFLISYTVSEPISRINTSAKELGKRRYDIVFSGGGYKEVDELCDTLNYATTELSKVDKLKNDLIANVSHDLRTPLTLISGYAEAMRDIPDEMTSENLQIIIDESHRMKRLVEDITDISKLQSGNIEFNMTRFDILSCISGETERFSKLSEQNGVNVVFTDKCRRAVFVTADKTRIMQVFYNLLNNAVAHMGDDKTVMVTCEAVDGNIRISVTDHGNGIPKEELPLIWERYYRSSDNMQRSTGSSGLGLSIVKTVMEVHHGKCGAGSTLGEGSTFWFELNICD